MGWTFPSDIWSVGCIIVELLSGEAMFQTHENREHLAIMEKTIGPLPLSMTKKCSKDSAKYFTDAGVLNWPAIANTEESKIYVSKVQDLATQCQKNKSPEHAQFFDLVSRLLQYKPEDRMTASLAMLHPFFDALKNTNTSNK